MTVSTMPVERPVRCDSAMVLAILDGRKTQMRIPITRVKGIYGGSVTEFQTSDTPGYDFAMRDKRGCWNELLLEDLLSRSPFGRVGDRIWVKETFCLEHAVVEEGNLPPHNDGRPIRYFDDGILVDHKTDYWLQPHYKATDPTPELCYEDCDSSEPTVRWKPSIHMPRWASRIILEIMEIRVQRVQEISDEEAISEGLKALSKDGSLVKYGIPDGDGLPGTDDTGWPRVQWSPSPREAFRLLWNSIYAQKTFDFDRDWEVNPWVWVISFKRRSDV